MRGTRALIHVVLAASLVAAIGLGVLAVFTEAEAAGPCICPKIYAPVLCDNGRVYPNQCVADCQHAKNCVPLPL